MSLQVLVAPQGMFPPIRRQLLHLLLISTCLLQLCLLRGGRLGGACLLLHLLLGALRLLSVRGWSRSWWWLLHGWLSLQLLLLLLI